MQATRAAIFDLDGLLIDSEPLWQRVEIDVFATVGHALTPLSCRETTGLRIDEVVATYAQSWSLIRMPAVDRAIARVGVAELLLRPEVQTGT